VEEGTQSSQEESESRPRQMVGKSHGLIVAEIVRFRHVLGVRVCLKRGLDARDSVVFSAGNSQTRMQFLQVLQGFCFLDPWFSWHRPGGVDLSAGQERLPAT
jgi:phage-related protein